VVRSEAWCGAEQNRNQFECTVDQMSEHVPVVVEKLDSVFGEG
jgi:hypothetical protein